MRLAGSLDGRLKFYRIWAIILISLIHIYLTIETYNYISMNKFCLIKRLWTRVLIQVVHVLF